LIGIPKTQIVLDTGYTLECIKGKIGSGFYNLVIIVKRKKILLIGDYMARF